MNKDAEPYIDFKDFLNVIVALLPFLAVLFVFNILKVLSSQISALVLIFFSIYVIWFFHIVLKSKGYGIGSWFKMPTFGPDLVWSIIMFPVVLGAYLPMTFLTSYIWSGRSIFGKLLINPGPLLAVISIGLFFPVAEEVVFRGALYSYLEKVFSVEFSIVMTSAAFAVVHPFEDWMKSFVLGIILNLLYYRRRTLTVPATIHVMVNLLYLSVMYLHLLRV